MREGDPRSTDDEPVADEGSTFQRAAFDPSPLARATFTLVVIEGPDRGKTFSLDPLQRSLLGKSETCDVRLTDPEVSRRHAALEPVGTRLRLTDLRSTNGTFVDGVSMLDGHVRGGEVVRVGSTALRIDSKDDSPPLELRAVSSFGSMIGASVEMRRLYPLCERLAAATIPVVIEGETGTGKEVLAEALHERGPRAAGPFVVFDCTAVPPSLVEAELFGFEKGAFTGATSARKGVFEHAHGGTLFIDEIGDLELSLQPKLLRAIERSQVRRVGGDAYLQVDVRVLAATRRDLDREVQAGRFRDDLFHRLAVGRIELPPLRRRRGDVPILATRFWRALGGSEAALRSEWLLRWEDYPWPGNVRELRNAVARALALGELTLSRGAAATPADPPRAEDGGDDGDASKRNVFEEVLAMRLPLSESRQRLIDEFEQRYVDQLLGEHAGNVTRAAEAARIGRRYLQKLRERWR
jgi:two-component system, NtrC family, response regulator HydG